MQDDQDSGSGPQSVTPQATGSEKADSRTRLSRAQWIWPGIYLLVIAAYLMWLAGWFGNAFGNPADGLRIGIHVDPEDLATSISMMGPFYMIDLLTRYGSARKAYRSALAESPTGGASTDPDEPSLGLFLVAQLILAMETALVFSASPLAWW